MKKFIIAEDQRKEIFYFLEREAYGSLKNILMQLYEITEELQLKGFLN